MPRLKLPDTLEKMAFDCLLQWAVRFCDQLSAEHTLDELRHGISVMKKIVLSRLPWKLLSNFCTRFLNEFAQNSRPAGHHEAALEILMDTEIVGLRFEGPILRYLHRSNAHRLRGLDILDLSYYLFTAPTDLENFHLNELTTFIFPRNCTDLHLQIIGRNCPKLEVVDVSDSRDVTDEGMRALSPCSKLRVVHVLECLNVSHVGLSHLLSVHEKLEDFSYGHDLTYARPLYGPEIDFLSGLDWSLQCPSMSRFVFEHNREEKDPVELKSVAAKFPNLTYLKVNCMNEENFTPLKSLNKLTGLEVNFVNGSYFTLDEVELTWRSIKELLTFVGVNITTLKLAGWDQGYLWQQSELNFIYDSCLNIEYLRFDVGEGVSVVPPFRKLKELWPCVPLEFWPIDQHERPALKLSGMSSLETLSLREFPATLPLIKAIILDNVKFPNLSVIETICVKTEDLAEIERIVRHNNLDIKINNDPTSNWFRKYRFNHTRETDDFSEGDNDSDHPDYGTNENINEENISSYRKRFDRVDLLIVGPGPSKR